MLLLYAEASAQIVWSHKTSDVWLNPRTQEIDSSICFTNLSCYDDNCTAAAILFTRPINADPRIAYFRSNDGGLSWFEQPHTLPREPGDITNAGMTKVQQIDSLNFVASGGLGIVDRTTDGGITWRRTNSLVKQIIRSIHFSDPMNGIITCEGYDSTVLTTSDGGESWVPHTLYFPTSGFSHGNGKFSVLSYGYGPLYTTKDNFVTVDSIVMPFDTSEYPQKRLWISNLYYGSDDVIIAVGAYLTPGNKISYALIRRSLDAGITWETQWIFPMTEYITRMSSVDRDTIFAAGTLARYLMSTDRGMTWKADTLRLDTNYSNADICLGMEISNDGLPIAIYGNGGFRVTSLIVRGEYEPASVEFIEGVRYFTRFYPNPTTGIVNIISKDMGNSPVTIMDIFGRVVYQTKLACGKVRMDLSQLHAGLYNVIFDYMGIIFVAGKIIVAH